MGMDLNEWDMRRAARMRKAENRYDRGAPAHDDTGASLYHKCAACDRATEPLVKLARATAGRRPKENDRRPQAEPPTWSRSGLTTKEYESADEEGRRAYERSQA